MQCEMLTSVTRNSPTALAASVTDNSTRMQIWLNNLEALTAPPKKFKGAAQSDYFGF